MAVTEKEYNQIQKDSKDNLNVSAGEFYFNKVRPFMQDMLLKCKSDGELIRTLEKVTNAADTFIIRKDYENFMESFDVLQVGITDRNYFSNGPMRKASEEEKQMVRDLIVKISDLRLIVKCEPSVKPEENKIKDRLNYEPPRNNSPIGENKDYDVHNMKVLTEPNPKPRIPNV